MLFLQILLVLFGITLLWIGGELLLQGSIALSLRLKMSRAMVGLTVVALGTSLPELCVSLVSLFQESAPLSIGNILGSNILNIAFIAPLAAFIRPLRTKPSILHFDVPIMLGVTVLTLFLLIWPFKNDVAFGGINLSNIDGGILLMVLLLYFGALILRYQYQKRTDALKGRNDLGPDTQHLNGWRILLSVAAGIGGLQAGAYLLVEGASAIAIQVGISQRVIGLTMVALGTSLPELFASLVALSKKEDDIVLGNIMGSNIINLLFIIGILGIAQGIIIPAASAFGLDIIALLIFSLLTSGILCAARALHRPTSLLLIMLYVSYSIMLFNVGG